MPGTEHICHGALKSEFKKVPGYSLWHAKSVAIVRMLNVKMYKECVGARLLIDPFMDEARTLVIGKFAMLKEHDFGSVQAEQQ